MAGGDVAGAGRARAPLHPSGTGLAAEVTALAVAGPQPRADRIVQGEAESRPILSSMRSRMPSIRGVGGNAVGTLAGDRDEFAAEPVKGFHAHGLDPLSSGSTGQDVEVSSQHAGASKNASVRISMLSLSRRIGRTRGVVEGGMGGPPRPSVPGGVEGLEDHGLVPGHGREIEPAVLRSVLDLVGLADAAGVAALGRDQLLRPQGAGVGDGQRVGAHRIAGGLPHLDDGEPSLEQAPPPRPLAGCPAPAWARTSRCSRCAPSGWAPAPCARSRMPSSWARRVWSKITTREAPLSRFTRASISG